MYNEDSITIKYNNNIIISIRIKNRLLQCYENCLSDNYKNMSISKDINSIQVNDYDDFVKLLTFIPEIEYNNNLNCWIFKTRDNFFVPIIIEKPYFILK